MNFKTAKQILLTILKSSALAAAVGGAFLQTSPDLFAANAQASAVFSRVDVSGNERIASDTIRSISGVLPGKQVSPSQVNAAIQNLYDSGLFETVDVHPERGRLVIAVVEYPTIHLIRIEGNKKLKKPSLSSHIASKSPRAFSPRLA